MEQQIGDEGAPARQPLAPGMVLPDGGWTAPTRAAAAREEDRPGNESATVLGQPDAEPAGTLIVEVGPRRLSFLPGATVGIGRDPANDVVLDSGTVSRRHAQLVWRDGGWEYSDLESTQGSFCEGKAVGRMAIRGPVTLTLGQGPDAAVIGLDVVGAAQPAVAAAAPRVEPRVEPPVEPPLAAPAAPIAQATVGSPAAPAAAPALLRPGGALSHDPGAAPTEIGSGAITRALAIQAGEQRRTVLPGQTLTIGRESDNSLVLTAATVSRHHARIAEEDGGWVITDLGSSAGTWHYGELIRTFALSGRQTFVLGDPSTGDPITVDAPLPGQSGGRRPGAPGAGRGGWRSGLPPFLRSRRTLAAIGAGLVAALVLALVLVNVSGGSSTPSEDSLARATVRLATPDGSGSGVIIDRARGLILTNAHVAAPSAVGQGITGWQFADEADPNPDLVEVDVTNGRDQASEPRFKGRVVAADGYLDIAVVKISQTMSGAEVPASALKGLTEMRIGNSDTAHSGDPITAIGYPGASQSRAPTITKGVISGIIADGRLGTNRAKINLDATISPGNSGGSATDKHGRLVGVTTWGLRDQFGQTVLSSMRPINLALPVIDAARQNRTYTSPWSSAGPSTAKVTGLVDARAGTPQRISAGCAARTSASGPLTIGFTYTGFPAGTQTDVMAALYPSGKAEVADNQVAVAMTTLASSYPVRLPPSGCATITFAETGGHLPSGRYLLKIGVGGDLRVVKRATVTLS